MNDIIAKKDIMYYVKSKEDLLFDLNHYSYCLEASGQVIVIWDQTLLEDLTPAFMKSIGWLNNLTLIKPILICETLHAAFLEKNRF